MKKISFFLILFVSVFAVASGAEHAAEAHGEDGIPTSDIIRQAANLGILVVALFFFIRKSVIEAFQDRQKKYLEQSEKTKSALVEAERALAGIKDKLSTLEVGEAASMQNAQKESNELKAGLIKTAEETAEKMKKEASLHIANELNKAKEEINTMILTTAVASAAKNISDKNQTAAQKQEEAFLKQLEQVRA